MPTYSDGINPPAPLGFMTVRNPGANKSITNVPVLLDTGADLTLVPRIVVETLGIVPAPVDAMRLIAFDGTASNAIGAYVELFFLQRAFRGVFLTIDDTQGIIGRDILNRFSLHLDGPRLVWDELSPAP